MNLLPQIPNTHLIDVYLGFMANFEMPVIGRHTKLGHGHLLSVWKAPGVQRLWRLVMIPVFVQKGQKTQ